MHSQILCVKFTPWTWAPHAERHGWHMLPHYGSSIGALKSATLHLNVDLLARHACPKLTRQGDLVPEGLSKLGKPWGIQLVHTLLKLLKFQAPMCCVRRYTQSICLMAFDKVTAFKPVLSRLPFGGLLCESKRTSGGSGLHPPCTIPICPLQMEQEEVAPADLFSKASAATHETHHHVLCIQHVRCIQYMHVMRECNVYTHVPMFKPPNLNTKP